MQDLKKGGFGKQNRGRPCDLPRLMLKGNSLSELEIDSNREGFLLSVFGVVFVLVTAAATSGAGATGERCIDGECGENRREKEEFLHRIPKIAWDLLKSMGFFPQARPR